MAHKLEGTWRSFVVNDSDPSEPEPELTSPDGIFHIKKIDAGGKITQADHQNNFDEDDPDQLREVYGQVIGLGPSLTIVMEHQAFDSDGEEDSTETKRYVGYLVSDEPTQLMIIGKRTSYDLEEAKSKRAAGKRAKRTAAAGQDDGTVILTKP